MSQTKRRRRTKHRGNAAGVVESRGRTGRRPTTDERKSAKGAARPHRLDQPPTWGSAAKRTAVILAPLVVVLALVSKPPAAQLVILAVFIFILYETAVNGCKPLLFRLDKNLTFHGMEDMGCS